MKSIRKGLKETEKVDRQNLTERAAANLAIARRAMQAEQKAIGQAIKETDVLLKPAKRMF